MRRDVMVVLGALAFMGPVPAFAEEPPATRETARIPGDIRVLAIEQRRGGEPVAVVELRGGATLPVGAGDRLGTATVTGVSLEEASLSLRLPVDDPRSIKRWRDLSVAQWSSVPAAQMGLADAPSCPTALLRIEDDVAVFRATDRDGAAAFVRLRAGDAFGGAWRVERVDSAAASHGVVTLHHARTERRIALASWRP